MRSLLILLLFGCLLTHAIGRPQKVDYNSDSDAEETEVEEDSDSSADSYSDEYEDTRLRDHGLEVKADGNRGLRKDNPSLSNLEEEVKAYPKRRKLSKFNDADDEQQEIQQRVIHHDVNKVSRDDNESERSQGSKGGVELESISNDEDRDMFDRNRELVSYINKQEYNANDDSEQPRYFKQYYNTMQAENKDLGEHKAREGPRLKFRNRRDLKEGIQSDNSILSDKDAKYNNVKTETDNEDEESAIKRHIKKLSKGELDHLLTSLPEEKRYILKKIIADTDLNYNGFINKREITKKAGAVEENNINENCPSDLGKVQGDSAAVEVSTNAASDISESGSSKLESISGDNLETTQKLVDLSVGSSSTAELSNSEIGQKNDVNNILNTLQLSLDSKIPAEMIGNVQIASKAENKREAHFSDLEEADDSIEDREQDYLNDQRFLGSQDEKGPSVLDDSNQQYEDKNTKREAYYDKQPELSDSLKSLEESFPNNYAYDDSGPYSGPLIRVKRKNCDQIAKKRLGRRVSDSKVAYVPYKAENEDEDNDEGNESDDEGFYDRTSYFANSNKAVEVEEDTTKTSEYSIQANEADNSKSSNMDSDTMSLGSDTDSVLSGVEGVDDNLMYNSGMRSRRTANENARDVTQSEADISTQSVLDEIKAPVINLMNLPQYQENVAFGPLPRNYDGDLARYKRVRRVKQQLNPQEPNSSNS